MASSITSNKSYQSRRKTDFLPWWHVTHNICNHMEAELIDKGFWLIWLQLHLQEELQLNPVLWRPTNNLGGYCLWWKHSRGTWTSYPALSKGCSVAMERRLGKQRMERGAEGEWTVEEGDVGHAVVYVFLRTESSPAFTQRAMRCAADSFYFLPLANKQAVLRCKSCLSSRDK